MCQVRDNVVARKILTRGGKAIRCQEFLHGKMGKLDDSRPVHIDDGDETGARRKYNFFRIAWSPACVKLWERSYIEPDRQDLCKLLNAKWSDRYCETLEESVCELSLHFVDPT